MVEKGKRWSSRLKQSPSVPFPLSRVSFWSSRRTIHQQHQRKYQPSHSHNHNDIRVSQGKSGQSPVVKNSRDSSVTLPFASTMDKSSLADFSIDLVAARRRSNPATGNIPTRNATDGPHEASMPDIIWHVNMSKIWIIAVR